MQATEFDAMTRELGSDQTRRGFFRLLGAAAALGSGLALAAGAVAAKPRNNHRGSSHAQHQQGVAAQRKKGKGKGKGKKKHKKKGPHGPRGPVGPHFTVSGRNILDANGNPVLLRGVNKMSVWDDADPTGVFNFPEIRKTGANTVRIVWAITKNLERNGPPTKATNLDALIANARAAGLVPMIELHDATGNWGRLGDLVGYWTQPQIVNIIRKHERYLLVNIGNEVGDAVGDGQFIAGYSNAVQRMRNAGIHTPLVIDAPDWGKGLQTLNRTAAQLLAADPDHNLIFSVHMYWGINDGASAQYIRDELATAVAGSYPLIVGEFSQYGAYDPAIGDSSCGPGGRIDYQTILEECDKHAIGWYAWEWGPGNGYGEPGCEVMDMTPDRAFASLKAGWAKEVAVTSPFSIANTAKPIL